MQLCYDGLFRMRKIITRELVAVIGIVGLASMAMALLQPMLPLYLTSLGVDPPLLGLMFSTGMAGMVVGESAGGWLADRVGLKIPLLIGTFLCAPLVLSFVFVTTPAMIFAVFFVWGIIRSAIFGPGRGYIGTRVPFTHKATVMAIYAAAMAAFRGLGTLSSGFIVDLRGYHWLFFAAAGVGILAGTGVLLFVKKSPASEPSATANQSSPAGGPLDIHPAPETNVPLYRHRLFISQSAIATLYFAAVGLGTYISLLAREVAGLTFTQVGTVFTIGAVVNALLLIPMGRLADRTSKRTIMVAGLLVTAAGQAIIGFSTSFPQIAAGMIVQATGGAMFGPAAIALLSETIPHQRQSTAMGIYGGCEDLGVIMGLALGGIVWGALGPAATFLIMGTASATLGALLALVLLSDPLRIGPAGGQNTRI
jgi:MFS family permease